MTDAIDALAGLNEATEGSLKSEVCVTDAVARRSEAKAKLDKMQQSFDSFVEQLRKNAPRDSYWGRTYRR